MLGVGVMIKSMGGNAETVDAIKGSLGKRIVSAVVGDDLRLTFEDDTTIRIWDGGQSCCEHRYMKTDDNLSEYVGAVVLDYELKDAPNIEDEYGDHEVQFLDVKTDKGTFQVATHNEHNGYYGGFWIQAEQL